MSTTEKFRTLYDYDNNTIDCIPYPDVIIVKKSSGRLTGRFWSDNPHQSIIQFILVI
jgi:hypothetical protein